MWRFWLLAMIGMASSILTTHFFIDGSGTAFLVGLGYGIVFSTAGLFWWHSSE